MLDSARQLLRWGIPGWLWFVFLSIFLTDEVNLLDHKPFAELFDQIQKVSGLGSMITGLVVGFVAASVPIGFIFYQIYHWTSWRGFRIMRTRPADRGWYVLRDLLEKQYVDLEKYIGTRPCILTSRDKNGQPFFYVGALPEPDQASIPLDQIPDNRVLTRLKRTWFILIKKRQVNVRRFQRPTLHTSTDPTIRSMIKPKPLPKEDEVPLKRACFKLVYLCEEDQMWLFRRMTYKLVDRIIRPVAEAEALRHNALVAKIVWYQALTIVEGAERRETECQHLVDIAHALGAARVAVFAALLSWLIAQFMLDIAITPWYLLMALLYILITILVLNILTSGRRSAYREYVAVRRDTIAKCFLKSFEETKPSANT